MGTAKTVSTPMEETFGGTVFEPCRTDDDLTEPIQPIQRYRQIVNHFEQVARANLGTFVQVADLSHIAGFNQRTLLRAFREVCGIGPYRVLC
jgi:transcriptional regulator GlxA family with amidase domain